MSTQSAQATRSNEITVEQFAELAAGIESEVKRVIVGQDELVRQTLICLVANGHALLEGVPGLGKTMLVRTIADVIDCEFNRIQFTPDLMPADIVGTNVLIEQDGQRQFRFQPGPVFANLLLADEINRATPKTQSALLEAMQEQQVSVARERHKLEPPFFVLATQNPLEMEGTYPLPEAQQVVSMQRLARSVPIAPHVTAYAVSVLAATHPDAPRAPELVRQYVRYGGSPRGAQALVLTGKISALMDGRFN